MATARKQDPFSGIRFLVKFADTIVKCTKVTGISKMTEIFKYTEGSDGESGGDVERKMLGQNKVDDVTIERMFTGDNKFDAWYEKARLGVGTVRHNVTIKVFDKAGGKDFGTADPTSAGASPARSYVTYVLVNAIPNKYELDDFDTARTEPLKERLILAYERLELATGTDKTKPGEIRL